MESVERRICGSKKTMVDGPKVINNRDTESYLDFAHLFR